ncbi:MAG: tetratricopeptide repeat protein [Candidatus Gastranaerophilales bacterium]|nr:tetratricopeptide repeat protein [Candidatus Gastranaerophilales bacterium]
MKKAIFIVTILFVAVISTACINNIAVQELNNAAKSYMDKGDYTSAIDRLESSLELDSTVYETYYNLGVAYIESKQYQKAIDSLTKAIDLNSKYADTYYTLAVAQENFADSITDSKSQTEGMITGADEKVSYSETNYQNLSDSDKEMMIQSYLTAISNYRKYSDMINSEQKTSEISNHISDMEKVLSKLGYSGSSY